MDANMDDLKALYLEAFGTQPDSIPYLIKWGIDEGLIDEKERGDYMPRPTRVGALPSSALITIPACKIQKGDVMCLGNLYPIDVAEVRTNREGFVLVNKTWRFQQRAAVKIKRKR